MKHKRYFQILSLICLILVSSASVDATTITLTPVQSVSSVHYWDPDANNGNGGWFYGYGSYSMGRLDGAAWGNTTDDVHRSGYEFDLSDIPDNAEINNAYLQGYIQTTHIHNFQGRLVGIPYDTFFDPEPLWLAVGNSNLVYLDAIEYNQNFNDPSDELKNVIASNLGIDVIKVGLLSLDENQNESEGILNNFQIVVDYSIPIEVTIGTNVPGLQFYVDGDDYTTSHAFNWYSGEEHTIGTNTPQTNNNTNYSFQNWSDGGAIEHTITPGSNQTITANFEEVTTVHIVVKNRHDGGYVKVDYDINHQQFPSGVGFDFDQGSTHDFEAWEQNYAGYDMEFKAGEEKWATPDGSFYTALIENHTVENPGTYWAQLWRICNFTADNHFLNGGSGGQIKVNGVVHQPVPYTSTNLEEDQITFEAPPQQQTVNGKTVDYNFLNWGDGNTQNPRTLAPSTNFNVLAKYKGHLVSATYEATSTNNGRRISYDAEGNLHCVYLDADNIWYTYSDDGGETWTGRLKNW